MNSRIHDIYRDVQSRTTDYREVERPLLLEEIQEQASHCQNCGLPFCHGYGCPLHNRIPDFNHAIASGDLLAAWQLLADHAPFPEFTGRVCPAICESCCTQGICGEATMIRQAEKFVVETAYQNGWIKPHLPACRNGKSVAVIGSGPAGLAAALTLNRRGFAVTVYEKAASCGGLMRYGIPNFKLDKGIVKRRISLMQSEGIRFLCNAKIGTDISGNYLLKNHDYVVVAIGTPRPRNLMVPGRELDGIHFATEFLSAQIRFQTGEEATNPLLATDKHVVIIGGGDTSNDCLGTALRQHAKSVTQLEIMPEPPPTRSASTPWPLWPYLLRTSSSHQEGGTREFAVTTTCFQGTNGHVSAMETAKVQWEFSPTGKPLKFTEVPDSKTVRPADLVLLAMGFVGVPEENWLTQELGFTIDQRGKLQGGVPGRVFAVGDCATGQSLVVRAAAHAIDTLATLD